MAGELIVNSDGVPLVDARGFLLRVPEGDDISCLCCPGICPIGSCVNITFADIGICDGCTVYSTCGTTLGDIAAKLTAVPSGVFSVTVGPFGNFSWVWSGVGSIELCDDLPGEAIDGPCLEIIGSCAGGLITFAAAIRFAWDFGSPCGVFTFIIPVFAGTGSAVDGTVLTNDLGDEATQCANTVNYGGLAFGGTATISYGECTNPPDCVPGLATPETLGLIPCCSTPECPDCLTSGPDTDCDDPLPATIVIGAGLTRCLNGGGTCTGDCTVGAITLTLEDGGDCTSATYFGTVLVGGGPEICISAAIIRISGRWYVAIFDMRCSDGPLLLWAGWLETGSGPTGTYKMQCDAACEGADGDDTNRTTCTIDVTTGGCNDNVESSTATEVEPSIRDDYDSREPTYFNLGASFAAGTYRVSYDTGALKYAGLSGDWGVAAGPASYRLHYNDGAATDFWPADVGGPFADKADAIAGQTGSFIDIIHTGGKIGMSFHDAPLDDNCTGNPSPRFTIALL